MTSPQDFDRLSAYLDNQLSPAEKAQLEARLEREPGLKTALDDLRMTVRALRSLPTVKPPRNFTLTPELARTMAAPRRVFPALRLATAFAALVFAVVVVGDFATNLASPRFASAPEVPVTVVAEKSAAPAETIVPPSAAQSVVETQEVSMGSAAPTLPAGDTATATETPETTMALTVPEPTSAPTEAASGGAGGEMQPQPTPAPSLTEEARQRAADTAMATLEPEVSAPSAMTEAPTPALVLPMVQTGETGGPPPLRYIEVGLALLTVLLAVAAWFLRGR